MAQQETLADHLSAPRVYRYARRTQLVLTCAGVGVLGFLGWLMLLPLLEPSDTYAFGLLPVLAGFAVATGAGLVAVWRSRVVLHDDALTLVTLGPPRRLAWDDVLGVRSEQTQLGRVHVLVPRRQGERPLRLLSWFRFDDVLEEWLGTLPDLDAEDAERSLAEVAALAQAGRSPEERLDNLQRARRVALWLNLLAMGLAVPTTFIETPPLPLLAAVALLPVPALLLLLGGRGLYRLYGRDTEVRPSLLLLLLLPAAALTGRALQDINLFDSAFLAPTAVGAALLVGLVLLGDRSILRQRGFALCCLPLLAGYPFGLLVLANARLDDAPPQRLPAQVVHRWSHSGTYHLELTPWAPDAPTGSVLVSKDVYSRARVGGRVVVLLRPGRLGMPWFEVAPPEPVPEG